MAEFDVQEIMGALFESVAEVMQDDGIGALTAVALTTPVGDPSIWKRPSSAPPGYQGGHAVANWQVSIDVELNDEIPGIDPARAPTISRGTAIIEQYQAGDVEEGRRIFIQNAVPYINRLNNGHSRQVPIGFIEMGVAAATQDRGSVVLPAFRGGG